jgi:hypothetical protein
MQKEQLRLLDALSTQAALAVDAANVCGGIRESADTLRQHVSETDVVWEIGQAVASKLSLQDLVDTLSEKLRTAVRAKNCQVLIFDPDEKGLRILGHKTLVRRSSIAEHVDQCDMLATSAAKLGKVVMVSDIPNSCHCKFFGMACDDSGTHHMLAVPMSLRGFTGAITVVRQNDEPFGDAETRLLTRLTPFVALGIRNAEMYEREKKIAETLQKSFLPDLDVTPPGYEISSIYKAAYDESLVGGDFRDLIDLGQGKYALIFGDVSGKGLDAAAYTAMTRYMIHAFLTDAVEPVTVLDRLNAALYKYMPDNAFVTLIYGVLDAQASTFKYVNAGHELPLLYKAGERATYVLQHSSGTAAGAVPDVTFEEEEVELEPGDVLVFYTDGATDARNDDGFLGTEGLRKMVDLHIRNGETNLPEALNRSIEAFSDGQLRDDLAILVIRVRKPGALF